MERRDAKPRGCAPVAVLLTLGLVSAPALAGGGPAPNAASTAALDLGAQSRRLASRSAIVRDDAVLLSARIEAVASERRNSDDGTARSENFFVTAPKGEFLARRVLVAAEEYRCRIANQWLGRELEEGRGFTFIHVEVHDDRDVGLAMLDGGRKALSNHIWLRTSAERATGTTLAHEIAHAVLGAGIPSGVPAWASEGVACQYDDASRIATRREIVGRFVRTGRWPPLSQLLEAAALDPADEVSYAAAVSLTEHLVAESDRRTFLEFVAEGGAAGWETTLERYHGLRSVDDLTRQWQEWAARQSAGQSPAWQGQ